MRLTDFDYELPVECIAQVPIEPRDAARLLVDRGSAAPAHCTFATCPSLLMEGDLLVVNDTKVIPARLRLRRVTGGAAEVLLLEPISDDRRTWEAMIRPGAQAARRRASCSTPTGEPLVEIGDRIDAGDTWVVTLLADGDAADAAAARTATCRCRPTSVSSWPNPIATRRSTPLHPASCGGADGRSALHARTARRRLRRTVSRSPPSSWSSASTRSSPSSSTTRDSM